MITKGNYQLNLQYFESEKNSYKKARLYVLPQNQRLTINAPAFEIIGRALHVHRVIIDSGMYKSVSPESGSFGREL